MHWVKRNASILFILLLGAVLRFWNYVNLPYCHDEISALLRTRFETFSELISQGVMPDGHPAGTQVLLWFWTKLGGYNPMWVKLPFEFAGIWSIWLIYLVGRRLKNEQLALIAAALLATLQFPITFSQWARPYSLGLAAVLALSWSLLVLKQQDDKKWNALVYFILSAFACAIFHYFALLQAMVITFFFLPFLGLRKSGYILFASFLAFCLWFPHLTITLAHLELGGIGLWLQPPKPDYWLQMLQYAFGYSWWTPALLLVGALATMLNWKLILSSYVPWFLLLSATASYVIAYFYSTHLNPVLHQSVLLFSLPFLLLFVAWFVRVSQALIPFYLLIIMFINVDVLARERDHFYLNYNHEFDGSLRWLAELQSSDTSLTNVVDLRKDGVEFLMNKGIVATAEIQFFEDINTTSNAETFLNDTKTKRLFVSITPGTDPELLAAALQHYPCIDEARYFHAGEAYLLSKDCESRKEIEHRQFHRDSLNRDSPYTSAIIFPASVVPAESSMQFVLRWRAASPSNAMSVIETTSGNSKADHWQGALFSESFDSRLAEQRAYHALYSAEMNFTLADSIRFYVWSQDAEHIEVEDIRAYSVPANTMKYRLFYR